MINSQDNCCAFGHATGVKDGEPPGTNLHRLAIDFLPVFAMPQDPAALDFQGLVRPGFFDKNPPRLKLGFDLGYRQDFTHRNIRLGTIITPNASALDRA
jgi:hypothetical protein